MTRLLGSKRLLNLELQNPECIYNHNAVTPCLIIRPRLKLSIMTVYGGSAVYDEAGKYVPNDVKRI